MKVSPETRDHNHQKIVKSAADSFRESGIGGVGLQSIMNRAGLTSGAFYGHFGSKDALVVDAIGYACDQTAKMLKTAADQTQTDPLMAILNEYFSDRNRDDPSTTCAIASLGSDMRSCTDEIRTAYTRHLVEMQQILVNHIGTHDAAKQQALSALATMVGTLVLARAVNDPGLSDAIMASSRDTLGRLLTS